MLKKWSVTKSEILESNRVFSIRKETSVSPFTETEHDFFIIDTPDWVNIVALTDDEEVILIEQFRHGIGSATLEIPGGMVDPGEEPLQAAKRELLEETGYEGENWVQIGIVHPNPAIQSNKCYTFLTTNCKKVSETNFDSTEFIITCTRPEKEIPKLVSEKITHSLVVAAFYWYHLHKDSARL